MIPRSPDNLAVASEQAGSSAVLVDVDPQSSAAAWGDSRDPTLGVEVVPMYLYQGLQINAARRCGKGEMPSYRAGPARMLGASRLDTPPTTPRGNGC